MEARVGIERFLLCFTDSDELDRNQSMIAMANDGTLINAGTFSTDNVFDTGGPTTLPQVD